MSQQQGTSIGIILIGMIAGGFLSAIACNSIPNLTVEAIVGISLLGPILGIGFGFLLSWMSIVENQAAQAEARKQWEAREVPVQIVGKNCSFCESRMMMANDGKYCERCKRIICTNCKTKSNCEYCQT